MKLTKLLVIPLILSFLLVPLTGLSAQDPELEEPVLIQIQENMELAEEDQLIYEYDDTYDYDYGDYDQEDPYYYETTEAQENLIHEQDAIMASATILAMMMAYIVFIFIFALVAHIVMAIPLAKLGKEMNYKNSWFAWVPILQMVMILHLGQKSPWLLLLILIPAIGGLILTVFLILATMEICEARGYDKLFALLILIPLGYIILLYLLAYQPKTAIAQPTETPPTPPTETPVQQ